MSRHHVFKGKVTLGRNMRTIIKENGGLMPLEELLGDLRDMGMEIGSLRSLILAGSMKAYVTISDEGMVWATGKKGD